MPDDDAAARCSVRFDRACLTLDDIVDVVRSHARPVLSDDPTFRAATTRGADFLDRPVREDGAL